MPSLSLNRMVKLEKKLETFHKISQRQAVTGLSANLNVLISLMRKAGVTLIRDFNELENLQMAAKTPEQFIATAETSSRNKIHLELTKARPDYGFMFRGEKEIAGADTSHKFICDQLNGGFNFAHSLPLFCISVALERNREIVNAAIYNPVLDELFFAEKNGGAFMTANRGNKRLRVSGRKDLSQAILASSAADNAINGAGVKNVRITGSAALNMAYVAAGKIDACRELEVKPWDTAAGMLIVREAGGIVVPIDSKETKDKDIVYGSSGIIAGNEYILKKLKGKL